MIPVEGVSNDVDDSCRDWRRSRRSYGSGACLEVATEFGYHIHVRDSKDPQGPVLRFAPVDWNSFLVGVRTGGLGL